MNSRRFENKVALVTGGSSGIGLEAARLLVGEGAQVVLVGRDQTALERARAEFGGAAFTVSADVALVADIERVMAEVKRVHGGIDVLFANAGMSECPPLAETDSAFFDKLMGINLKG